MVWVEGGVDEAVFFVNSLLALVGVGAFVLTLTVNDSLYITWSRVTGKQD